MVIPLREGSAMETADGHSWVRIHSRTTEPLDGWMATDYLRPLAEVPCSDGACYPDEITEFINADQAIVVDGPVNFRAEPGTDGEILMTLDNGDYVFMVTGDQKFTDLIDGHYWMEATVSGQDGFVAVDFLDPVK
jgi:hypothetical protein